MPPRTPPPPAPPQEAGSSEEEEMAGGVAVARVRKQDRIMAEQQASRITSHKARPHVGCVQLSVMCNLAGLAASAHQKRLRHA